MSRTKPGDSERAELLFECYTCGAQAHEWCVTRRGRHVGEYAKWLHSCRWWRVKHVVDLSGWSQWCEEADADLRAVRRAIREILTAVRHPDCERGVSTPWLVNQLVAALQAHGEAA